MIDCLLEFLTAPEHRAYGVEFRCRAADTPQSMLLEEIAGEHSLKWIGREYSRATIRISDNRNASVKWPKSLRENRSKLKRPGTTEHTLRRVGPAHEASTATFLALENRGWNTNFARFSPGMLQHLELLEKIGSQFDDVDLFDSCTVANSPIERVWPDRRKIASGVFTYAGAGTIAANAMRRIREFRVGTRNMLRRQK